MPPVGERLHNALQAVVQREQLHLAGAVEEEIVALCDSPVGSVPQATAQEHRRCHMLREVIHAPFIRGSIFCLSQSRFCSRNSTQ